MVVAVSTVNMYIWTGRTVFSNTLRFKTDDSTVLPSLYSESQIFVFKSRNNNFLNIFDYFHDNTRKQYFTKDIEVKFWNFTVIDNNNKHLKRIIVTGSKLQ